MSLLDRYILGRFLTNFVLLFMLLFLFAVAIDVALNLDEFVDAARDAGGDDLGVAALVFDVCRLMLNFQGPRLFQFYAYLHGMVALGSMGFVLAQMYRNKELVATMASGVSLQRVAMPFVVGAFALSLLQLLNQELLLPRVAPLLLRGHSEVGRQGVRDFEVSLTRDSRGHLLQSPRFDPRAKTLTTPTMLERDARGRTTRRITAELARWDEAAEGWRLTDGQAIRQSPTLDDQTGRRPSRREPIDLFQTDLDPETLVVRRHGEYAAMLSLRQIGQMLEHPGVVDTDTLLRHRYTRFSTVLVNVLVMLFTLPTFLLREPTSLMRQTLIASVISLPVMLAGLVLMTVKLPGISPAVGVFLPVVLLIPLVVARALYIRS